MPGMGTTWGVALAGAFLLLSHFAPATPGVRERIVGAIGEGPYRGLYSLVSVAAFVWIVRAYDAAPHEPLAGGVQGLHWAPAILVLPASLLLVGSLSQRNPTAMGQEKAMGAAAATGVMRVTRHPLMWAVALWAISHLVANPDAASVWLFGTFALLALVGTVRLDAKKARAAPDGWAAFAGATSNVPFLAIAGGRQRLVLSEIGWGRAAAAVALYAALAAAHPWLFGVGAVPV
jgi:uncharacterized membrane protein